ncbi:Aste57867_11013 [Aphanomyces stellatus]|uniref:Aste57867_11013 protein n=1 Tax=Aphanomyces stellatus TaxID=120398 RepID=A0A485KS97_9STRA|nr:hypothetical protein As57867_010972 [Aphanomyces stellatus]VFT87881.1 Aste57867_11013 [Aphanomyces stellatus]
MQRRLEESAAVAANPCNLSERSLTAETATRALKAFPHITSMNLSRNNIGRVVSSRLSTVPGSVELFSESVGVPRPHCPASTSSVRVLGAHVVLLSSLDSVIDLSFNRLTDVEPLMFCYELVDVDVRGNRLTSPKGLESLKRLERLDLSDNVIESYVCPILGNPIATMLDYRVLLLDLIPQVALLDGKRQSRQHFRCLQGKEPNSYAHMYDAKKAFKCLQAKTQGLPTATACRAASNLRRHRALLSDGIDDDDDALGVVESMEAITVTPRRVSPTSHAGYCPKSLRPAAAATPTLKMEKLKRHMHKVQQPVNDPSLYVSLYERVAVASGAKLPLGQVTKARPKSAAAPPMKRKNVISPPKVKVQVHPSGYARRQLHFDPEHIPPASEAEDEPPITGGLNPSQMKVLGVIQGLIQHKRQTIASLHTST